MTTVAIGDVRLTLVHDTDIRLTPEELFLDWDDAAVEPFAEALGPAWYDPGRRVHTLPVHSWVLRSGGRTILVDTGCGDGKPRPGMPDFDRLRTGFLGRLAAAGVRPADVDLVLCTHLHVDHVGWNTRLENGRWVPTFPNARYLVSATELDHARTVAAAEETPEWLREVWADSVRPVLDAGRIVTVDGRHEVDAAVAIVPAPGHTPGHVRVEIRSRGAAGILCGDILHTPLQGPLWRWRTALSTDPDLDVRTRRALLEDCVEQGALLLPAHFRAPGHARVRAREDGFALDLAAHPPGANSRIRPRSRKPIAE